MAVAPTGNCNRRAMRFTALALSPVRLARVGTGPRLARQPDFREVDARLALVRRVVAHPQEAVVPDQAGVTGVAATGQGQHRLVGVAAHAGQGGPGATRIAAANRPETAVGQADEVRAA